MFNRWSPIWHVTSAAQCPVIGSNDEYADSCRQFGPQSSRPLDHGNATLVGLLIYFQRRLESVLNFSTMLIYDLHISDAPASVHWLRVRSALHIWLRCWHPMFYVARRLNTCQQNWWAQLMFRLVASCSLCLHPSWWCQPVSSLLSAVVHFLLPVLQYGASYLLIYYFCLCHLFLNSSRNLKRISFISLTLTMFDFYFIFL